MTNLRSKFSSMALCCSLTLFLCTVAGAQFKASIQGTVTDPSGAVVSGAAVTVTNQETNRSFEVKTGDDGFYRVSGLAPGKYSVTVELEGFKKRVLDDVTVNAEAPVGVNITLEAGSVSEAVTINASESTGALQTENANINRAITSREIRRIPQAGRDPYELIRLTPGVLGDASRAANGNSSGLPNTTGPGGSNSSIFQTENQVPISANGQRVSANNFQIDGVSVNSLGFGGAAVVTPNQESVKEMRVIASAYSAEYGRNTGAQIEVVSQNGTNSFHGSALFKYNDPGLNAFNKFGDVFGGPSKRVIRRFRQYGGSLGGPIVKDKLFFFFSYEGVRENNNDPQTRFVETPEFRQLVSSQRSGSQIAKVFGSAGIEPRIINVLTASCADFISQGRPCSVIGGRLDIGSPTGGTGQYVSLGKPDGGGLDGVPDIELASIDLPNQLRGSQYNARVDFNPNSNNQFAVSTYFTGRSDLNSDLGAQGRPIADLSNKPRNSAATITWIRTISATTLNEARANFTRFASDQVSASSNTNFGIPRIEVEGLPLFPPGERIRFGAPQADTTPAVFAQNTFEVRDIVSKLVGNHGLKFGIEIRKEQDNNNLVGGARPDFSFSGLFNLANETPIFEGINTDPTSGFPADAQRYFRTSNYGFFFQDDWKVRPNLTLNFGLRYEIFTPLKEKQGRITNLIFPPGRLDESRIVIQRKLFDTDHNNFSPRLGFAWSPEFLEQKLVVRGGFGISYNRTPGTLFGNSRLNPPFFAKNGICCGTASTDFGTPFVGGKILFALGATNSPFSYPVNPVLAQGIDPATGGIPNNTVEIWGTEPQLPNAYVYSFSLDTEYQLPAHLIAGLGYQGSSSHKFIRIADLTLIFPASPRFNPVFFLIPDVNGNYHAMLARLSRAFAQGFRFDAVYRFSKSIDTLSYEGPGAVTNQTFPADQRTERGPSDYDVRHNFVLSGTWDLPIFRERKDWVGKVLGGWEINGIWTKHSGFPWTPKIFRDLRQPSGKFFGPIRPRQYFGGAGDDTSDQAFLTGSNFPGGGAMFFDTTIAGDPPTFELNPPGIGRNSFRGPKYSSVDMSLVKNFGLPKLPALGEGARLELRANFFNAFNQLNLLPIGFFDPGADVNNSNFGRAKEGLSGRVVELQARFSF
ncbi:MAG TPA: TonB-dependent receptor [Blastocatellia bacterium]|nr:TonB-dependent receptor [Blastocatellia bacterium]